MPDKDMLKALRFYFVTDDGNSSLSVTDQVRLVVEAGSTAVQYRNKAFTLCRDYDDVIKIRSICRKKGVLFIVNDNILLAKAIGADGVHLGQDDEKIYIARRVLGVNAILGLSVSTAIELEQSDLQECDYVGAGPVFNTTTKVEAKPSHGLDILGEIARYSPVPVVAIGGINSSNARRCIEYGAAGIAAISCITRSNDPARDATELSRVCLN